MLANKRDRMFGSDLSTIEQFKRDVADDLSKHTKVCSDVTCNAVRLRWCGGPNLSEDECDVIHENDEWRIGRVTSAYTTVKYVGGDE